MVINTRKPAVNNRPHHLIAEPNQAFTVRQIIEQFARGETTAKAFEPTDDINDQNYSETQLLGVVDDLDEFEQRQYLMDLQESLDNEKEKQVSADNRTSVQTASGETQQGVQPMVDNGSKVETSEGE